MNWKIKVCKDLVKGIYNKEYQAYPYFEVFYIVASNGKISYIHYYNFVENKDKAEEIAKKIRETEGFSPENKKNLWFLLKDPIEYNAKKKYKRDWRWLLMKK